MSDRPNILLVTTDQQRADPLGLAGMKAMPTPNLDRLGREGVHFERAYTPPTRSAGAHGPGSSTTPWPATRATSSTSTATLRSTPWCWTPRATACEGSEGAGVCDTDAIRIDSGHGPS